METSVLTFVVTKKKVQRSFPGGLFLENRRENLKLNVMLVVASSWNLKLSSYTPWRNQISSSKLLFFTRRRRSDQTFGQNLCPRTWGHEASFSRTFSNDQLLFATLQGCLPDHLWYQLWRQSRFSVSIVNQCFLQLFPFKNGIGVFTVASCHYISQ